MRTLIDGPLICVREVEGYGAHHAVTRARWEAEQQGWEIADGYYSARIAQGSPEPDEHPSTFHIYLRVLS